MRLILRFIAITTVAAAGIAGSALVVVPQLSRAVTANHGVAEEINLDALPERSLVFDRYGNVMATLHAEENRSPVHLADVPQPVIDTFLAVEDENFYQHEGVDGRGVIRALFENVASGGVTQGGSTITMQVVKNSLLSPEQNLERKIKEAVLANRLEEIMTKDEILERYLNTVYLGNGAYGLQAGAEIYFGTNVAQLGWAESALLAAIIRYPSGYDPFTHPELALERRNLAIDRLVETGHLTREEGDLLALTPLPVVPHVVVPPAKDYFVEEVKQQLLDDTRLGETPGERYNAVFKGGLRIYTTFDPRMQLLALQARNTILPGDGSGIFYINQPGDLPDAPGTASLVSVEPGTGAIRAMVGGPGFENYQYNIATQGLRQPGSSMKTFVLVTLLENGYVPSDTVDGSAPCSFPNPGGVPDPYIVSVLEGGGGVATVASQTARSVNCAFVRLGQIVGLEKVVEQAQKMGVTSPLAANLSLPLGSMGISPLEMAGAYSSIANDGIYNKPYYIDRVTDRSAVTLFEHQPDGHRAMSQQTARLAAQVLTGTVTSGTGTRARISGRVVAGKTGTANDYHDAWFVGFTPQLATSVWMGSWIGEIPMKGVGGINVFGGTYPARIWQAFMLPALDGLPALTFEAPEGTRVGKYLRLPEEQDPFADTPRPTYNYTPPSVRPTTTRPRQTTTTRPRHTTTTAR